MACYDSYKDSGIEWVGKIPNDWDVHRLKNLGKLVKGSGIKRGEVTTEGMPCVRYGELYTTYSYRIESAVSRVPDSIFNQSEKLGAGEVLFAMTGENSEDIGICIVNCSKEAIAYGGDTMALKEHHCDGRFLMYSCNSDYFNVQRSKESRGDIITHLPGAKLADMLLIVPPRADQTAIANFLDMQAGEIAKVISEVNRSIVLLREYRQSIITEAVTHGLDPNAPMKPSGIEWMGDIPANWNTSRGKAVFAEKDIRSKTGEEELLTVSHITGVTPRSAKNVNMFMAESLVGYKVCEVGDIAANTMWLWQGAIGVAPTRGVISYSYSVYRQLNNAYDDRFLDYLLRSNAMVSAYCANSTGITKSRLRLYPDKFLTLKWPIPPMSEQKSIAAYLDAKTAEIDALIASKTHQVELLREYRKSIISEAVTGKFKVPGLE